MKIEHELFEKMLTAKGITKNQNILVVGATGTGKSFFMQALAKRCINL